MVTARPTELDALVASAEKKYDLSVGPINGITSNTQFLTTGNLLIDSILGGGVPLGRTNEFLGPPSSGKTTLTLQCAIELQKVIMAGGDPSRGIKADDVILYEDFEQAMDLEYAVKLGLDPDHPSMLFTQPDTLEQGADFALAAFKTGRIRLGITDSVAAMNPSAMAEADSIGKSLPAIAARLLKVYGVNLNVVLRKANASMIFINHELVKFDMGGRPGAPPGITTPGGVALKYFASTRVQFKQIKNHKAPYTDPYTREVIEIPVMTDVLVKVLKNKVSPPFKQTTARVRFGRGFDAFWTAMQILVANKQVIYGSQRFYFHNIIEDIPADWMPREAKGTHRPSIHGDKALLRMADTHPEWRQAIIDRATELARDIDALAAATKLEEPEEPELADDEDVEDFDDLIESSSTEGNRVRL